MSTGRFRIRQAGLDDLTDLAAMKALAWRQSYPFSDEVFDQQDASVDRVGEVWRRQAELGTYFWAVIDHGVSPPAFVGVAQACVARDEDAPVPLELAMIFLLDVAKGSGIADRLIEIAIGDAPAYLWVLEDYPRAQAFYRRHGFEVDGARKELSGTLAGVGLIRMTRR